MTYPLLTLYLAANCIVLGSYLEVEWQFDDPTERVFSVIAYVLFGLPILIILNLMPRKP